MATTMQPTTGETTKQLVNYRTDGGVAVIEMCDPPANTYTYEMNRQLDEAILKARMDNDVYVIVHDRARATSSSPRARTSRCCPASIPRSSITSACTPTKCCCAWNTRPSW